MVGERAQRGLGHRVDHVGRDQLLDVEHVGVGRILGAGAGPERPLGMRAGVAQGPPARVREALAVAAVGALGVRDRHAAAQVRAARQQASALASTRETKNEATEAIASTGSPAATRRSRPAR